MSLFETTIEGTVVLPPKEEQLSPRQLDRGGRNVPRTSIRLRAGDGQFWAITFAGEMAGQVSQGDYVICAGYTRRSQGFVATQIWLRGALDASGALQPIDPPLLVANRAVS